jgi:hypothetical protein
MGLSAILKFIPKSKMDMGVCQKDYHANLSNNVKDIAVRFPCLRPSNYYTFFPLLNAGIIGFDRNGNCAWFCHWPSPTFSTPLLVRLYFAEFGGYFWKFLKYFKAIPYIINFIAGWNTTELLYDGYLAVALAQPLVIHFKVINDSATNILMADIFF